MVHTCSASPDGGVTAPAGNGASARTLTRVLSQAGGYIIAPAQEACLQVFGFASALDRRADSFRLPPTPAAAAPGTPAVRQAAMHAPPAQDRPDAAEPNASPTPPPSPPHAWRCPGAWSCPGWCGGSPWRRHRQHLELCCAGPRSRRCSAGGS